MPETSTKLTKRAVDGAIPKSKRYCVWDTELKGLALRIAPSGTKTYLVRYRPRGGGPRSPKRFVVLGRHGPLTADQARAKAKSLLGEVAAGRDPAKEQVRAPEGLTVAQLAEIFIEQHVKAKRKSGTAASYSAILRRLLLPKLGKKCADKITVAEITQIHLARKRCPYQANRLLSITGSMYSFAAKNGLVPRGTNPTIGVERYRESSRERYLTTDELNRLGDTLRLAEIDGLPRLTPADKGVREDDPPPEQGWHLFKPEVTLAFRLLLFTGARLREILHLEWRHVDLERGLLLLPDSKTGRKTIVLSTVVIELLSSARRVGRFVIPGQFEDRPRSDLKKPWQIIQHHAGLDGVRIHDLRHTFASIGAGASLGLPVVGKLLGHTQSATTARYAHLDADPLRRASDLIGAHLALAMAVRPIGRPSE